MPFDPDPSARKRGGLPSNRATLCHGPRAPHFPQRERPDTARRRPRRSSRGTGPFASDLLQASDRAGVVRRYSFLFDGGAVVKSSLRCSRVVRWCSFLFRRLGQRRVFVGAVSASQFHAGPSGGQKAAGACRDNGGVSHRLGWLEGLLAGEDVPGGDEDLAGDGGFGGILAGAAG